MKNELVRQPSIYPTRKVAAGITGGGATAILIWVLGLFGVELPAEVAAELGAILATVVGLILAYVTKDRYVPNSNRIKG